jgi:hypothetical protein
MIDYNFLKIQRDRFPTRVIGEYVSYPNRQFLHLRPDEEYAMYFYIPFKTENIEVYLVGADMSVKELLDDYSIEIKDNYFYAKFKLPSTYSNSIYDNVYDDPYTGGQKSYLLNCYSLLFKDVDNDRNYYTDLFYLTDYHLEKTKLITYFHLENKDNIPYYDFNYKPQIIRVPLYFKGLKDEVANEVFKNNYNTPNKIKVSRIERYTLENWESMTTPYIHTNIGRAMDCDYFYIETTRYVFKGYDYEEDSDQYGFTLGNVDGQKLEEIDDICNGEFEYFNYYTDSSETTQKTHYVELKYSVSAFGTSNIFKFFVSFDNGLTYEEVEVTKIKNTLYSYVLPALQEHILRITVGFGITQCTFNYEQEINYLDMNFKGQITSVATEVDSAPVIIPDGWEEIIEANIGTTINGVLIPNLLSNVIGCASTTKAEGLEEGSSTTVLTENNIPEHYHIIHGIDTDADPVWRFQNPRNELQQILNPDDPEVQLSDRRTGNYGKNTNDIVGVSIIQPTIYLRHFIYVGI